MASETNRELFRNFAAAGGVIVVVMLAAWLVTTFT
jgi:hypothetical protein